MSDEQARKSTKSIHDRLKNEAKSSSENLNFILARFGAERLLYRLSVSAYNERFILKGGTLLLAWQGKSYRVTRDVDFLGFGSPDVNLIEEIFRTICQLDVYDDGLIFSPDSVKGSVIRHDANYSGVRLKLVAMLGNSKIPLQVDIGFGDIVTPKIDTIEFPTLLDMPNPQINAYTRYTFIAEKFEAMISLGIGNSRVKDFYDIWLLCRLFEFNGQILQDAILATFERRKSQHPSDVPFAFTEDFYNDTSKQIQWRAFVKKSKLNTLQVDISLEIIVNALKDFIMPIIHQYLNDEPFEYQWRPETQEWL